MSEFQSVNSVPLVFVRSRLGAIVTGLTVTVKVYNAVTGSPLLSTTSLSEITPGVYSYNWPHGLNITTQCVAFYVTGGLTYPEFFTIDNSLDIEETRAVRAV